MVTAPGVYDVTTYPLPTTASEPYDIAVAAGAVWVTERSGNQIARFDLLTELWTEYLIPTDASQPTGLAVLPGDPVQVWFCEQAGNKLARLLVPAVGPSAFEEFPLPWTGAAMIESVAAVSSEGVSFTAAGAIHPRTVSVVEVASSRANIAGPWRRFLRTTSRHRE